VSDLSSEKTARDHDADRQPSRREFARRAALAATAVAFAPTALLSQEAAPKPAVSPEKPPQTMTQLSPELQAEGELKYQWVIERYGSRLSEEQKKDIHRLILEGQKPLAAFRAFSLDNSDQPATVLKLTDTEAEASGSRKS